MKITKMMIKLVCLLLPLGAGAQSTHWTVNPYDFQYDMTAYVTLSVNGNPVTDYANFEIAAFCGEECRGVAAIQTVGSGPRATTYGYLRIRSNQAEGESIYFKVYHKDGDAETSIDNPTVVFNSQDVLGLPSSPVELRAEFLLLGDVNGDGYRDITDVLSLVDVVSGKTVDNETRSRADINHDTKIDVADIVALISLLMVKEL